MSTPKITRAVQNLLKQISHMARTLTKGLISWLLRGLLMMGRKPIASAAGFVLPTTVLLLLVVTLTVGAIGFRTYTRSQQAIGERQQRVIYNAATPAIDRAKAKLEFIFNSNRDRRSGGVPGEKQLMGMMLNDDTTNDVARFPATGPDPYTFPKETRIDINNDGKLDNAWRYETEEDASGRKNRIVYSIVFGSPTTSALTLRDSTKETLKLRAKDLLIRNAPLSNNTLTDPACVRNTGDDAGQSLLSTDGWFEDQADSTMLRKNFQVDAYVLPLGADDEPDPNSTVATLEFQQDREATQGFRWAAWFRNDLEIFPGPDFNWNGAMHTEGSYFLTSEQTGDGDKKSARFKAFMVSDPDSCLYKENASSITTPTVDADASKNQPYFQGQFIAGEIRENSFGQITGEKKEANRIDLWNGGKNPPIQPLAVPLFDSSTDSIKETSGVTPEDFALDPIRLHTQDVSASRGVTDFDNYRDDAWKANDNQEVASPFGKRLKNQEVKKPYLDDMFRADNRYGPKPTLDESGKPLAVNIGSPIIGNDKLTNEKEGLDGYWERRARTDGLRIIVGQRLELGDLAGWGGPTHGDPSLSSITDVVKLINEPLRPWLGSQPGGCTGGRCNEARQRRSLWDNLAAVQATAIYHKALGPDKLDYPAACMATTVHPGTAGTLDKSATFENLAFGFKDAFAAPYNIDNGVISDFFRGRGTNGWQYSVPDENDLKNSSSTLIKALKNLAYFAGDPNGGAPSFEPVQGSTSEAPIPHPFPSMAMWGDFSMLRRILDNSTPYANLSFADKTTLHTAACMLSMLAYNIDYLNKFKPDYLNNIDPPSNLIPEEIIGKANITPLAADVNDPYWKGLRGHIRAIDALIYDESALDATDGVAAGVPDLLRIDNDTKIPIEIKKLPKKAMEVMSWIETNGSTGNNDPETYVRLLEFWRDSLIPWTPETPNNIKLKEQLTKEIALARLIITKEQVGRDRRFGFAGRYVTEGGFLLSKQCQTWYDAAAALPGMSDNYYKEYAKTEPLMRLCSDRPRYPILFSLFPVNQHGDVDDLSIIADTGGRKAKFMVRDKYDLDDTPGDPVMNFKYLSGATAAPGNVNASVIYQVLSNTDIGDIAAKPKKLVGLGFGGDWTLPTEFLDNGSTPNGAVKTAAVTSGTTIEERYDLIKICPTTGTWQKDVCSRAENISLSAFDVTKLKPVSGPRYRVPFKDSALMNGRELMSVRALNLDLDLMRRSSFGSDYWLPKSGIIYAFREDAVSEAHIVRPKSQVWQNCDTVGELLNTASCQMDTAKRSAMQSIDPPLNDRKISAKPVDFYPDPDRRPHGFRLRNGAALWRGSSSGSEIADDADPAGRGLSFITHNPAYVQGYFNLHRAPGKGLKRLDGWEEFEEKLNTVDFTKLTDTQDSKTVYGFYNRTKLESNFADRKKDQWRPAEVLGDAVTLLSPFFCDGSIEDGIITAAFTATDSSGKAVSDNHPDYGVNNDALTGFVDDRYGCSGSGDRTSYLNQNRATKSVADVNGVKWMRSSIVDTYWRAVLDTSNAGNSPLGRSESPIYIVRNGDPMVIRKTSATPFMERYDGMTSKSYAMIRPTGGDKQRHLIVVPTNKDIQMNMILISGLIPSRGSQANGGLHNFPRFIENWNHKDHKPPLYFSGAFLQLNFSTYATAPFDQEQWQPDLPAPQPGRDNNEWLAYYGAPQRRWGFDVGLKYAPPGPVAERFRSPEPTRSEFYDEPPADDPYICLLARVANPNNSTCPPI